EEDADAHGHAGMGDDEDHETGGIFSSSFTPMADEEAAMVLASVGRMQIQMNGNGNGQATGRSGGFGGFGGIGSEMAGIPVPALGLPANKGIFHGQTPVFGDPHAVSSSSNVSSSGSVTSVSGGPSAASTPSQSWGSSPVSHAQGWYALPSAAAAAAIAAAAGGVSSVSSSAQSSSGASSPAGGGGRLNGSGGRGVGSTPTDLEYNIMSKFVEAVAKRKSSVSNR
ncbi:hypothetical protein HDU76_000633, partial [Blyttiomyces sp. JEL0837]